MATTSGVDAATWLRQRREGKHLSQADLAARVNVSKSFISQLETNKYEKLDGTPMRPSQDIVDAIADAVGSPRSEARDVFNYASGQDEATVDEVMQEFTYAVARYKRLPEDLRTYFRRHAAEFLDLLLDLAVQRPKTEGEGKTGVKGVPARQTIRKDRGGSIPEISEAELKRLARERKDKSPRSGGKDENE